MLSAAALCLTFFNVCKSWFSSCVSLENWVQVDMVKFRPLTEIGNKSVREVPRSTIKISGVQKRGLPWVPSAAGPSWPASWGRWPWWPPWKPRSCVLARGRRCRRRRCRAQHHGHIFLLGVLSCRGHESGKISAKLNFIFYHYLRLITSEIVFENDTKNEDFKKIVTKKKRLT